MKRIILAATVLAPSLVFAAATVNTVLTSFVGVLQLVVPLAIAVALVVFIWGLVIFIANSGDEKKASEGRQRMIWGVLALFLIVSVWGVVTLLMTIFGVSPLNPGNECNAPSIDIMNASVRTCT